MASFLPDKVLTEEKLAEFIARVNVDADKIVGDSKFQIPPPELPGLGVLIKLWIRQSEKSFATYFLPVIVVRDIIDNADKIGEIPGRIIELGGTLSNPDKIVQLLLDITVNPQIDDELFIPLKILKIGATDEKGQVMEPSADFGNLKSLVSRAQSEGLVPSASAGNPFPYILGITGASPNSGEYTFRSNSTEDVVILVSSTDYNGGNTSSSFSSLIPGDEISISKDSISQSWIIKQITQNPGFYSLSVTLKNKSVQQAEDQILEQTAYIKVAQNSETEGKKALKSLITGPDGRIEFPIIISLPDLLSLADFELPAGPLSSILSQFVLRIGNFDDLPITSPLRAKIKDLEAKAGWDLEKDVIEPMLNGEYPVMEFKPEDQKTEQEKERDKAREQLLSISKLFEILVNDTALFFIIIVNYIKLLLLPLFVVLGTLSSAVGQVLQAPLTIFKFIVQLITDPIKLLGGLIAKAIVLQIKPYLQPAVSAAGINWDDDLALEKIGGKETGKGIEPLIRDIIIGRFDCMKFDNPKDSKISNSLSGGSGGAGSGGVGDAGGTGGTGGTPNTGSSQIEFTNYSYNFRYDGVDPQEGEVSFNSQDLGKVSSIKINTFDSNVNSVIPELLSLVPGSEISVPLGDKTWLYRVVSFSPSPGNLTYFQYGVVVVYNPETQVSPINPVINSTNAAILSPGLNGQTGSNSQGGSNNQSGSSNLNVSFTTPSEFLKCLIDNYLPIRAIAIWESIKGILAIVMALAISIPSLIKAIIESLFSGSGEGSSPALKEISQNPSRYVLRRLASLNSDAAKLDPRVIARTNPDLLTIQDSKDAKEFVDALIGENGIDTIIVNQSKSNPKLTPEKYSKTLGTTIRKQDGTEISTFEYGRNLKVLLSLARKFAETGSLKDEDVKVSYLSGFNAKGEPQYQEITVKLNRSSLNQYRIITAETTEDKNKDVIVFIRDNIYIAKQILFE